MRENACRAASEGAIRIVRRAMRENQQRDVAYLYHPVPQWFQAEPMGQAGAGRHCCPRAREVQIINLRTCMWLIGITVSTPDAGSGSDRIAGARASSSTANSAISLSLLNYVSIVQCLRKLRKQTPSTVMLRWHGSTVPLAGLVYLLQSAKYPAIRLDCPPVQCR